MIWRLTKLPEEAPVDVFSNHIVAYHPWTTGPFSDLCVKILLSSGSELLVKENMREIRYMLDSELNR